MLPPTIYCHFLKKGVESNEVGCLWDHGFLCDESVTVMQYPNNRFAWPLWHQSSDLEIKEQGQYCEFCKLRFTGHCPTKTMPHKVKQVVLFKVRSLRVFCSCKARRLVYCLQSHCFSSYIGVTNSLFLSPSTWMLLLFVAIMIIHLFLSRTT